MGAYPGLPVRLARRVRQAAMGSEHGGNNVRADVLHAPDAIVRLSGLGAHWPSPPDRGCGGSVVVADRPSRRSRLRSTIRSISIRSASWSCWRIRRNASRTVVSRLLSIDQKADQPLRMEVSKRRHEEVAISGGLPFLRRGAGYVGGWVPRQEVPCRQVNAPRFRKVDQALVTVRVRKSPVQFVVPDGVRRARDAGRNLSGRKASPADQVDCFHDRTVTRRHDLSQHTVTVKAVRLVTDRYTFCLTPSDGLRQ